MKNIRYFLATVLALAGLIESLMALFRPHTRPATGPGSARPFALGVAALQALLRAKHLFKQIPAGEPGALMISRNRVPKI